MYKLKSCLKKFNGLSKYLLAYRIIPFEDYVDTSISIDTQV